MRIGGMNKDLRWEPVSDGQRWRAMKSKEPANYRLLFPSKLSIRKQWHWGKRVLSETAARMTWFVFRDCQRSGSVIIPQRRHAHCCFSDKLRKSNPKSHACRYNAPRNGVTVTAAAAGSAGTEQQHPPTGHFKKVQNLPPLREDFKQDYGFIIYR